jgi:hypothetical protein
MSGALFRVPFGAITLGKTTLNIKALSHYAECCYAEYRYVKCLYVVMPSTLRYTWLEILDKNGCV